MISNLEAPALSGFSGETVEDSASDVVLWKCHHHIIVAWWLIPVNKWDITPVINGISVGLIHFFDWGHKLLTKWGRQNEPRRQRSGVMKSGNQHHLPNIWTWLPRI